MKRKTTLTLIICLCGVMLLASCSGLASNRFFDTTDGEITSIPDVTTDNYNETTDETTISSSNPDVEAVLPTAPERINYTDVKAMWLTQFDLNDAYFATVQREVEEYREIIKRVLDNCVSIGVNTVIVQVRPNADSMYPSEYFTPSL